MGRLAGFCLVSSDSDFTRLASRLREQDLDVYGFGAQKTPESFRQACRRFIYTETLLPEPPAATPGEAVAAKAARAPSAVIAILDRAIAEMATEDGWATLTEVGQRLLKVASDFDPRSYGCKRLSDLARKTGAFEVDRLEGLAIRIRARPAQMSNAGSRVTDEAVTS